MAYFMELN